MGVRSLVVAAATALLVGCTATGTGPDARPAESEPGGATVAVDPAGVPPCPRWDADPVYPDGDLPAGATSLRVCPGEETLSAPRWQPAIAAPGDPLTTGVGDVVALLDDLPDWEGLPEDTFCSQEGRPRIHYVFGYPDGSTRSVTYGYGECHLLELEPPGRFPAAGTIAKEDAASFMDAVADGLLAQRRGAEPPRRPPAAPTCVPEVRELTTLPIEELELATASLCVPEGDRWRRAVVPSDLVARLADEYTVTSAAAAPSCASSFTGRVVGWSTWGDPVELQFWEDCATAGSAWTPEPVYWSLSSGLADELSSLPLGPPVAQR